MNRSLQARKVGFAALRRHSGEALILNTEPVTALRGIVNRKVDRLRNNVSIAGVGQKPDFSVLSFTEIEVAMSDVSQPSPGQNFKDELKFRHRVSYVTHTDFTWVCYCVPSQITEVAPLPG